MTAFEQLVELPVWAKIEEKFAIESDQGGGISALWKRITGRSGSSKK